MIKNYAVLLFVLAGGMAQAQKLKKEDKQLMANLQQHVHYLADDKLEGRRTGTRGEKLAAEYISNEFKKIDLLPKGSNDFYQPFEVNEGKQVDASTFLKIDDNELAINKDYYPLGFSGSGSVEAMPSLALQEPNMPWFYDIKELIEAGALNPHYDLNDALYKKVKELEQKGATALLLYNSTGEKDGLRFNGKDRSAAAGIPVVYLTGEASKKYIHDPSATLDIKLKTSISEKKRNGTNVVGYIDNGAPATIILGAHFDHLGLGEDGNSRETDHKTSVHNGADDNASGIAALVELARLLKTSKLKNHNYLFIGFSGEELGLYGSKYFTEHPTVDLSSVNYMINMDMVGRLNDSTNTVTVGGYGTSPGWGLFFGSKDKKNRLFTDNLAFRYDSSGTGPSDHTSFYLKNIPVLFYFTGLHSDYHKSTDDADKINYNGQLRLIKHIYSLLQVSDKQNKKLVFTKTREAQTTTSSRFTVSMGIMPDYTFSGAGVRVDGVSENKPAQKAGLKTGDVITALGDFKITSLESYMQALGKYKKGDKAGVDYTREGKTFSTTVEF